MSRKRRCEGLCSCEGKRGRNIERKRKREEGGKRKK